MRLFVCVCVCVCVCVSVCTTEPKISFVMFITNSWPHIPSPEDKSRTTFNLLWNWKASYRVHKNLSANPPHSVSLRSVLISSSQLFLVVQMKAFLADRPLKPPMNSPSATCPAQSSLLKFNALTIIGNLYNALLTNFILLRSKYFEPG
jgi:hypothetical protein